TLAVPRMTHAGSAVIHTPDKSGFPFASRGAGADRSTSPAAVRGARGLGYLNHWAPDGTDAPTTIATSSAIRTRPSAPGRAMLSLVMRAILTRGDRPACIARDNIAYRRIRYAGEALAEVSGGK